MMFALLLCFEYFESSLLDFLDDLMSNLSFELGKETTYIYLYIYI